MTSSRVAALVLGAMAAVLLGWLAFRSDDPEARDVWVRLVGPGGVPSEPVLQSKVVRSDAEWRALLGLEAYRITRGGGTERAFCGGLLATDEDGVYSCVGCGLPLFSSSAKYDSRTGWPSFFEPFAAENVARRWDFSGVLPRIETRCARCGAHLGHNFGDGPPPTRRRYCMNSAALVFTPLSALEAGETRQAGQLRQATFAAGSFWRLEESFRRLSGVIATQVGYTGGATESPSFAEVREGATGHAEAVEITYDSSLVGYDELLTVYWVNRDPAVSGSTEPPAGSPHRRAIFVHSDDQRARAEAARRRFEHGYRPGVATEIVPAGAFWRAEEFHQQYLAKRRGTTAS